MQMKPKARRGSLPRAAYGISIARSSITFYHKFAHGVFVTPANVLVLVVHRYGDLFPALPEYVPPAQDFMLSRVPDLYKGGPDHVADGPADDDLSIPVS